jgi:DNA-binding transcriptional LysR family regulator
MDLRHLRYFVAVAETLSFGRAAERLHISQPPLSRQIRGLEHELGAPLFSRTRRSVRLTAAGAALLPEARRLLRDADALQAGARQLASGEVGTLALGFISVAAYNLLPELAPEFRRRHPGIKLALQEATSDVQLAALGRGELDVGLVLPPVEAPALEYAPLLHDTLVAALPAGRGGRGPIALASLRDEPFILFPRTVGTSLYDQIAGACERAGFAPRVEQEAIQMQTIISLVAAGMGVALVPASLMKLRRTGVVYRPLADARPRIELGIAWRRGDDAPAVRAFVGLARTAAHGARAQPRARGVDRLRASQVRGGRP